MVIRLKGNYVMSSMFVAMQANKINGLNPPLSSQVVQHPHQAFNTCEERRQVHVLVR